MQVLEKCGLKPDVISGTSAGALAGVFMPMAFIPKRYPNFLKRKSSGSLSNSLYPRLVFFKSTGLHNFLKKNLRAKRFEELQMPFYVVATDWDRACTVTFSNGDNLIDAVVASCSIPVIFHPQIINDVSYVDGGLLKKISLSLSSEKKCKYVIGVNVSLMIPPAGKTTSALCWNEHSI